MSRRVYSVDGRLGELIVRGRELSADIAEAVTSAKIELSTDQGTQLTITLADTPDFAILDERLFDAGTPTTRGSQCDYGPLRLEVRALEVGPRGADHTLTVTARSVGAGNLKRAKGARVRRNLSPTQWAALEAKEAGLDFVGEPSKVRKTIARQKSESAWATLQRLAEEVGYLCFEVAGVLYFAEPTWLVTRTQRVPITWEGPHTDPAIIALPSCRRTGDDAKRAATLDVSLLADLGEQVLPGMGLVLDGVPTFDGLYMVNTVTIDLAEATPVSVNASTPIDPVPQPPAPKTKSSAGSGGTVSTPRAGSYGGNPYDRAQLGNALTIYRTGRAMDIPTYGIIIAIAVACQESRLRNVNHGDRDSLGLFQQRASWGSAATRMNPAKSARLFYEALRKVSGWQGMSVTKAAQTVQRSAYPTAYADEENDARAIVTAIEATATPASTSSATGSSTGSGGRGSAALFVSYALKQAGDRYVYGAETSASDANPNAFDCSELVQWAAGRAGVAFVDGSSAQLARSKRISVDQAIRTRGALLFHPGHVAISLGNGKTIEAANSRVGVVSYSARGRFTAGGLIPGMRY